jgi:hypothetical protein
MASAVPPEFSANCGVPVTVTGLLNPTVTGTIAPAPYVAFASVDVTPVIVGAVVSIMMLLFAPSEPAEPGAGNVRFAGLLAESSIVPPFNVNAVADV